MLNSFISYILTYVYTRISGPTATFPYYSVARFGMLAIVLSIIAQSKVKNVFFIPSEYCWIVSYVIFFSFASFVSFRFTRWNELSIGFKFYVDYVVVLEIVWLQFFIESFLCNSTVLTWMNIRLCERLARRKMSLK